MNLSRKQSGFTLVEIVIVIAIMGIIGGLSTLIIGRSLDAYAALERREKLQTSIRLAIERISRELRHALPHSVCVTNGDKCAVGVTQGTGNQFYFIPVKDSGRYQDKPGIYVAPPPIQRDRLGVNPLSSDRFDVLSTNSSNRLAAATNDWVVVYNINNFDIYNPVNSIRWPIQTIIQKDIHNDGSAATDIDQIQLAAAQSFDNHSPARRFHIIDNSNQATLFAYNAANGNLIRETTTFSDPHTTTTPQILMQNVTACKFTYTPGSQQRAGLLQIDITVERNLEQIQVIHDAHVYNTP